MDMSDPKELLNEEATEDLKDHVRNLAYELFEQRGKAPGHDLEDWLRAEGVTLEEELNVFDTIFEQLPVGCLVTDSNGKIVRANHEARRLLGATTRDVPAAQWTAFFGWHLPDRVTLCPPKEFLLSRSLRGERVAEELGFLENPSHPGGIWVRASSSPIINGGGARCGAGAV